ncbi:hypothetical protein HY627_00655 [Candidatus Uhrbacteria bacterium]|nr:hypothetical protein [Candidatus Uhrbacteria bacterium]
MSRIVLKSIIFSVALTLGFAAVGGVFITMKSGAFGMSMNGASADRGAMPASCPMTTSDHLTWWNSLFAAVPCAGVSLPLAASLAFVFFSAIAAITIAGSFAVLPASRGRPIAPTPPLQELFSNGILHSKRYA